MLASFATVLSFSQLEHVVLDVSPASYRLSSAQLEQEDCPPECHTFLFHMWHKKVAQLATVLSFFTIIACSTGCLSLFITVLSTYAVGICPA